MHEASITRSIIDTVLDILEEKKVEGIVTVVNVTVGVSQGLIPESLQMFFDIEKPGTPLENARLAVEVQRMVAHCETCDADHELDLPVMFCPDCGKPMKLVKGNEITLTSIEMDE
ncbi:hydrogenase maturation nickel metallochaperone HypA [Candidatus Latescibacterota bacterium]